MKTVPGGLFLVFSGPEGGGKSTQARALAEHLREDGYAVYLTREPGGISKARADIRTIILTHHVREFTEFLLFCADRTEHVANEIIPAIRRSEIVICDRYVPDSYAYQYFARKAVDEWIFWSVMGKCTSGLHVPELTFWFDLPARVGLERKRAQEEMTRFEREGLPFHEQVALGFRDFFTRHGEYAHVHIDAGRPHDEVHGILLEQTYRLIAQRIGLP